MIKKREWHRPKLRSLDARATAQTTVDGDNQLVDPNRRGDIPAQENGESHTIGGAWHPQADGPNGTGTPQFGS
jgi:hypothetical protein